ncbi:thioesterase [Brevibacterium sp. 5221]|uniref:Thioesterase n=1 Tax=Brevibacterium rongguiense TaxID=2695267 RepID=A0A6N9H4P8_9MICO|nr:MULTISPECIES: thioesterase family protein [Brevibacterium]MYM19037.1 thioesterase [Brevibacterium rongguiense]WAL40671.1 thioesterase family protein [Brevibacterium sp. BRM-1]
MPASPVPAFAQVAELPILVDRAVPDEWIDVNGHMNIAHYLDVSSDAVTAFMNDLGLAQSYRDERGLGVFTAEQHLSYYSELHAGQRLTAHVRLVGVSSKAIHLLAFVLDPAHDRLAMVFETVLVHVDLRARSAAPVPADLRERLDASAAEHAGLAWEPPLCGVMGVRG